MRYRLATSLVAVSILLCGCASPDTSVGKFRVGKPYSIAGKTYYPEENYTKEQTGIASWYGPGFDGKKTANGERFDQEALTAAHPTLQMPSLVRVTNLENGQSIVVRVNDRGPFHSNRVMDLSKGAARAVGMLGAGTARVRLQVLGPESVALAQAAKQGVDTRGAEIAMNDTGQLDARFASFFPTYVAAPQPQVMVAAAGYQPGVSGTQMAMADTLAVPQEFPPQTTIIVDDMPKITYAPPGTQSAPGPVTAPIMPVAQAPIPTAPPVRQLPERHKAAIFQMSPIAEANAAEVSSGTGIAPVALGEVPVAPQPNYLPAQPKFLGMRPIVESR